MEKTAAIEVEAGGVGLGLVLKVGIIGVCSVLGVKALIGGGEADKTMDTASTAVTTLAPESTLPVDDTTTTIESTTTTTVAEPIVAPVPSTAAPAPAPAPAQTPATTRAPRRRAPKPAATTQPPATAAPASATPETTVALASGELAQRMADEYARRLAADESLANMVARNCIQQTWQSPDGTIFAVTNPSTLKVGELTYHMAFQREYSKTANTFTGNYRALIAGHDAPWSVTSEKELQYYQPNSSGPAATSCGVSMVYTFYADKANGIIVGTSPESGVERIPVANTSSTYSST